MNGAILTREGTSKPLHTSVLVAGLLLAGCAASSAGPANPAGPPATGQEPAQVVAPPPAVMAQPADGSMRQGDRVSCRWKGGATEYTGRVAEVRGDRLFIQYDDGDQELIDPALCRKDAGSGLGMASFPVGSRVLCRWKGQPKEFPGSVASIEGDRLHVEYDDGDTERIDPSLCRTDSSPAPPPAQIHDIVTSSNPGGGNPYRGQLAIRQVGETSQLRWTIEDSAPYAGIGLSEGNLLGAGWSMGSGHGVVIYRIQGGSLRGRWAASSTPGQTGTEDLQGPPNLKGTYQIVASSSPGGGSYTGSVTITPTGSTYALEWNLTRESYKGVGIRRGNVLVVGWGPGQGAGVVVYEKRGDGLDGVWATGGGTQLGTEVLKTRNR